MRLSDYLFRGWTWNPCVIAALALAAVGYARLMGRCHRWPLFAAALGLLGIAFLSPLNLLAAGVLFSAHMTQHLILLLVVPGLVLLSLADGGRTPRGFSVARSGPLPDPRAAERNLGKPGWPSRIPILTWFLGVGSMWFWHVPQLCNAAATSSAVHAIQAISLLGLGLAFWWPVGSPGTELEFAL